MNKILIFALLLAAFIIGGAVMVAKKNAPQEDVAQGPTAQFSGEQVVLDEQYQSCAEGEHCIVVDTHCGFCCKYTAINSHFEQDFNRAFDKNCSRYRGTSCSCFDLSSYPSCVEGKCQLIGWPDEKRNQQAAPPPQAQAPQPAPTPVPEPAAEPVQPWPQAAPPAFAPQPDEPAVMEPVSPVPEQAEPAEAPADDLFAPLPETPPAEGGPGYNTLDKPLPSGNIQ